MTRISAMQLQPLLIFCAAHFHGHLVICCRHQRHAAIFQQTGVRWAVTATGSADDDGGVSRRGLLTKFGIGAWGAVVVAACICWVAMSEGV